MRDVIKCYEVLDGKECTRNIAERRRKVVESDDTMTKRYAEITGAVYCDAIYDLYMSESLRTVLTRWRLSCFDLMIEKGRYMSLPREERICSFCDTIEDEHHVIFNCRAYDSIRTQFIDLLKANTTIQQILNPRNKNTAEQIGKFLKMIEDERKLLL